MFAQLTPEQANELLKAIQRLDWLLIVGYILWAGAGLLHYWLTRRIEAAVANKQHFSRLRYEREIEVYRDAWKKLQAYYGNASLRFTWKTTDPQAQGNLEALQKSRNEFYETIADNRPFFPHEVWDELKSFLDLCQQLALAHNSIEHAGANADRLKPQLDEAIATTKAQHAQVENAIRVRLAKFDGA